MKFRVTSFLAALLALPLLLISTNAQHQVMASPMPDMMKGSTTVDDCLIACRIQFQSTVTPLNQREVEKEKEPKPEPAEPYYLAFVGIGWTTAITVAAAYLLKYPRWRPPDIFSLYSYYRF